MRFDAGQLDKVAVCLALRAIGYDGVVIPHEYPASLGLAGEDISHGWVVGYLVALRQWLNR